MITLGTSRPVRAERKLRVVVPTPLYGGSLPVAYHVDEALRGLGHETILLRFDQHYGLYQQCGDAARDQEAKRTLQGTFAILLADLAAETAITSGADLVWYTAQSPVSVRSLRMLRSNGIQTAFWFVEDIRRFEYWKALAPEFDIVFSIQQGEALQALSAAGARRVEYLPSAANPAMHRPLERTAEERAAFGAPVAFVGAGYPNRVRLFDLAKLRDVKLWGNDWPPAWTPRLQENGRRVSPEETVRIYNATDINLNIHSGVTEQPLERGDFVNPRTFEIAACRAFQIVDRQAPMAELFSEDEIAIVDSVDDLTQAIDRYLADPAARHRMSEAAFRRVLSEHTYEHRMRHALECLGLSQPRTSRRASMPTIVDLKAAAYGDLEMQAFFAQFDDAAPARLADLVARIPAGERELSRAELIVLLMNEFRQWGVEKSVIR